MHLVPAFGGIIADLILDFFKIVIWGLVEPILILAIGIACIIGGIIVAFILFSAHFIKTRPLITSRKAPQAKKAPRVALDKSPLFMACLQKIADSQIDSLYVNSHMACFNFTGNIIREDSVFDFIQAGYEPIDEARISQYYAQLIKAAEKLPNVVSVSTRMFSHLPQPYLIANGRYNMPGDKLVMLEFKYRVVDSKKLKSFKV